MDDSSGYDCNWLKEPPDDLKCLICLCVARNPHQHPGDDANECGKIFCLDCINKLPRRVCPNCNGTLNTFKDVNNSRRIKELSVRCKNLENGCSWTGELRSLDEHLEECGFSLFSCPYECKEDGEIRMVLEKNLSDHLNSCPRREYRCPMCGQDGEYEERVTTHLEVCPEVKVKCPNDLCAVEVSRCEVLLHRLKCDFECVPCKYEEVGCQERPLRKDLFDHENDSHTHLEVTTKQVLGMKRKISQLESFVVRLAKQQKIEPPAEFLSDVQSESNHCDFGSLIAPVTFEVNNFSDLQSKKRAFYSEPFYTSKDGYKMQIKVRPAGRDGDGADVSVYAYLMKGVNDESLDWPYTGIVDIELRNQLSDTGHHTRSVKFSSESISSRRVIEGERRIMGKGFPNFINYSSLGLSWRCQYLKDDKLIFKIYVK